MPYSFNPLSGLGLDQSIPLDGAGKIPSDYLPSYVDDVVEYANLAGFPATGETGKIYVAIDTGFTYRWSGSVYIQINTLTGTFAADAGTAAAPSVSIGTADNGLYAPAEDQVAISTNGTQRLLIEDDGDINIDSGGVFYDATNNRLAIGTTSPAKLLHVQSGSVSGAARGGATTKTLFESSDASRTYWEFQTPATAVSSILFSKGSTGNYGSVEYDHAVDSLILFVNNNERARIDSSGRLLVGTSTARSEFYEGGVTPRFQVEGDSTSTASLAITRNDASADSGAMLFGRARGTSYQAVVNNDRLGKLVWQGANGTHFCEAAIIEAYVDGEVGTAGDTTDMPGRLVFSTTADGASSPTERMRIGSGGDVLVGTTSINPHTLNSGTGIALSSDGIIKNTASTVGAIFNRHTSNGEVIRFNRQGVDVGSIDVTTSATSYNTSSDYRLKENVVPLTGAADRLKLIPVHRFNFIADPDKTIDGFIAHEAQAVVPESVTGTKDEVDDEGNPVYQGIDQSKLVPLLTAALQEALAEIESLKARVTALEP